ncbi:MAG: glycosyltransferase family 4 protein, partial [Pseudomonadota bacterium]
RNSLRRFGQACVMHHRMAPTITHIYAHFLHTPSSSAQYCAMIRGCSWSASAHAKDIWTSNEDDLRIKMQNSRWVATCTSYGLEELARIAGRRDHLHLIYHGVNWDEHPKAKPIRPLREPVQFISVGRIVPKKGYDDILSALALLPAHYAWHYHIIGAGDDAIYRAQAQRLGIGDHITWHGALAHRDVFAYLQKAHIFLMGSKIAVDGDRDGMPNVLMEALAQRLAVVATDTAAIGELIAHDETGLLVPADDCDAFAQACVALLGDARRYHRLAEAGHDHVRENFGCDQGLDRLYTLLQKELA